MSDAHARAPKILTKLDDLDPSVVRRIVNFIRDNRSWSLRKIAKHYHITPDLCGQIARKSGVR
jgi:hypothetical protein